MLGTASFLGVNFGKPKEQLECRVLVIYRYVLTDTFFCLLVGRIGGLFTFFFSPS